MDKAKQAVSSILGKAGHHDTTVHESVAPAVQKETVNEHRREEQQVVKDREVHQDHYHTSVQPVKDQEVLPEQHHHKQIGTEHRTHDHRDHSQTKQHLQNEASQFKNESVRAPAHHTTTATAPEVAGEHVHHHIHEKVQPVVHKETIEPHVVHTTVPVHEKHYNAPQHHTASALPAVNMGDFKKQGGSLTGRDEEYHHFKGEPQNLTGNLDGHHGIGHSNQHTGATGVGDGRMGTTDTTHHTAGKTGKPSLMDKLNPKKDADGDGKAGFMH